MLIDKMGSVVSNPTYGSGSCGPTMSKAVTTVVEGLRRSCQNDFYCPVLKHGPRSLTHMRVCWRKTNTRNESNRCQAQAAASADHDH